MTWQVSSGLKVHLAKPHTQNEVNVIPITMFYRLRCQSSLAVTPFISLSSGVCDVTKCTFNLAFNLVPLTIWQPNPALSLP